MENYELAEDEVILLTTEVYYNDVEDKLLLTLTSKKIIIEKVEIKKVSLLKKEENKKVINIVNISDIKLYNVVAKGDYFGMNSENIEIDGLNLSGNYCFDGGKNIIVRNSKLVSKDAFWNCENVTVYDSVIIGEYLAWNTKNITFVNCTIESLQGLCYIEGLKMVNCKLINTTLAFEFCKDIDAQIVSHIDSITNPISGKISAQSIGEMIIDDQIIDPSQTKIQLKEM